VKMIAWLGHGAAILQATARCERNDVLIC
jgi:hypothetical protein